MPYNPEHSAQTRIKVAQPLAALNMASNNDDSVEDTTVQAVPLTIIIDNFQK